MQLRIEKGLKAGNIKNNAKQTFERVFLKQNPDVFEKSGGASKVNIASAVKTGAKVALAAVGAGLAYIGFNNKNKLVECTPEELDKIEYAAEQDYFGYNYDDIKALNYFKQNEPDFFKYLMDNVEKIKFFNYTKPNVLTSYLNVYRAKVDESELCIYVNDKGEIFGRIQIYKDENKKA